MRENIWVEKDDNVGLLQGSGFLQLLLSTKRKGNWTTPFLWSFYFLQRQYCSGVVVGVMETELWANNYFVIFFPFFSEGVMKGYPKSEC